jgi:hypothetical protein
VFGYLAKEMSDIPPDFVGYAGEPESELDIVFLMGLVYDHLPFRLVVSSINDAFPDCQGFDPITKKPVRIEFEVLSRNYLLHDHPWRVVTTLYVGEPTGPSHSYP